MAKKTDGFGPASSSRSFLSDATTGPSFFVASDAGVDCASVALTNSAKNVSVYAKGDLEAIESSSDICPFGASWSAAALLSVPDRVSSAVPKHVNKPAATNKSPRT